jgi:hypothetical protein
MPEASAELQDKGLSRDRELEQYIHSFTVSSDRVRYLLLISLVASILAFMAYWNSLPINWLDTRTEKARIAFRNELWREPGRRLDICRSQGPAAAEFLDPCEVVAENLPWVIGRKHSEVSLKAHLEKLEQIRVDRALLVRVPWLGIDFDINDLGAFSAISFSLVAMTLCFALARQHENLYLCLWKVRKLAEGDQHPDRGDSEANFLYHALAMAQVFTRPPSLARWHRDPWSRWVVQSLLFIPLAVQLLITLSNAYSFGVAHSMSSWAANLNMALQVIFTLLVASYVLPCYFYVRAIDKRWHHAFFTINPQLRNRTHTSWMDWVKIGPSPSWGLAVGEDGSLYVGQPFNEPSALRTPWAAWKIVPGERMISRFANALELPESIRKVRDDEGNEYRFQPSPKNRSVHVLVCVTKEGAVRPVAGGKGGRIDGTGSEAGFSRPRLLLRDPERRCLYAMDGACLRRISPDSGQVETLGIYPLGGPRSLWPRLLGLALDGDRVLAADYDYGCVWEIREDGTPPSQMWQSRKGWAPAGIASSNGKVYILEHRTLTPAVVLLSYLRFSARVWVVSRSAPSQGAKVGPRLLLKLAPRTVRLL